MRRLFVFYPYGMPMVDVNSRSEQPYKFGGKEMDRTGGLDLYDFEARQYDSALPGFTSADPKAPDYSELSPYAYCAGNPLRYVDPTGTDVWEINHRGEIVQRTEDKTQDAFYLVSKDSQGNVNREYSFNSEGEKVETGIVFKYGTIINHCEISYQKGKTYDIYKIRGDKNGMALFEFFAENVTESSSKVEFSLAQTGIAGDKGLNFITTAHLPRTEPGMSHLLKNQVARGYTIRHLMHSHPINVTESSDDRSFVKTVKVNLMRWNLPIPVFWVYFAKYNMYTPYDEFED